MSTPIFKESQDAQRLIAHGWRRIGTKRHKYGFIHYWDHPDHQPDKHGAFTTTEAQIHQREFEAGGCDCIKTPEVQ